MKNKRSIIHSQRGFSLMEIMIVIALIAVAGTFVTTQLVARMDEGYYTTAKTQIGQLKQVLEDYRRLCLKYPTSEQGLDALHLKQDDCANYPASGFLKVPLDPWGRPYMYESPDGGKTYVISSFGKDGVAGGDAVPDKDINSNEL